MPVSSHRPTFSRFMVLLLRTQVLLTKVTIVSMGPQSLLNTFYSIFQSRPSRQTLHRDLRSHFPAVPYIPQGCADPRYLLWIPELWC
ncbi:hypothetical protein BKA70DRAFT_270953 [Coprinopsis sp. MPI-PUGE-AT-0042]|nr:hypothetical protein BKA70DRAFT_270953 [Coprinopsis sp. MPI-PUGE-AT-0042]